MSKEGSYSSLVNLAKALSLDGKDPLGNREEIRLISNVTYEGGLRAARERLAAFAAPPGGSSRVRTAVVCGSMSQARAVAEGLREDWGYEFTVVTDLEGFFAEEEEEEEVEDEHILNNNLHLA